MAWYDDMGDVFEEFVQAPFTIGNAIGEFFADQIPHPSMPAAPWGTGIIREPATTMNPYEMNDATMTAGPAWENAGTQNWKRRRVLPRGPGSTSPPAPGWRAVHLQARRGYAGRPEGDYWKRSVRMNPLNINALRRALRRTSSATRMVRRLLSLPRKTVRLKRSGRRTVKV